jgi:hypothetical protein
MTSPRGPRLSSPAYSVGSTSGHWRGILPLKDRLIEYLERFIGELIIMTEIAGQLRHIQVSGIDRLLMITAARSWWTRWPLRKTARLRRSLALGWSGLRSWFIRDQETPSQASARCTPARLSRAPGAVANIGDRRATRAR